ncbi:sugar phosphate isomerase/epimerase family protein [Gilvimarinus sp. SDUM040013]|uniref:Sugar phosphate isomerase/epimerase family protein n=1 Tax=Gilvimarinus gilvus TaxID=3058038 RepID=A0ABU4RX22_9GAMM|nr:sugar phosphate isomerase/epimerase family protein [Gilvimarinus sp. SDUM040013]MDO3386678.1 sugar phosphate isomerase/epimerase family protein [Gilvimarinus sp. SDUM040013]MDX6849435.1 sugar phosphate isomerase/epimerase family protein [Gilvimarinus sp. SDUM040013]
MLNLGLRAHDYGQGTPAEIAALIGQYDVSCVQLAPAKSFPMIGEQPGQLSPGFANQVRDAFAAQGISIAVLGCYINPIHPDPVAKEQGLKRFEEHLRFARDFGCAIVGTETGSKNGDCSYHPDSQSKESFIELVDSVKRMAKTAEKYGTIVGIEGVAHHHTVHTYEKMLELLEAVNSPNVQVIYDPVNFFPLDQCHRQQELMDEAFDLFGDRIVAIHSKDFVIKDGLKDGDLPSGTGEMDHRHLMSMLQKLKPGIHTILESTNPQNVQGILKHLRQCAE